MTIQTALLLALGIAIVVLGIAAVLILVNALMFSSEIGNRLETFASTPDPSARRRRVVNRAQFSRFRLRLNSMLSLLASEELAMRLLTANWPITETEYSLIRIWVVLLGFAIGYFAFGSILPGIGLAIVGLLVPPLVLTRAIQSRRSKFEKQLVDVLVLIRGSVGVGYSFLQALDVVIEEMGAPASEEFRRVRREVRLGLPLGQALTNLGNRMQNNDLDLVITAVKINAQVGGSLSMMLDAVTETIRERIRLFGEIRAITGQQRFSGYVLTVMPFLIVGILFILSPTYISRLFEPGPYLCIPIGALILMMIGNILIRQLAKIDV